MAGRNTGHTGDRPNRRRLPLGRLHPQPLLVLGILLVAAAVISAFARVVVDDEAHRLLVERTNEVGLVLSTSVTGVQGDLAVLGQLSGPGDESAFVGAANSLRAVAGGSGPVTFALLRPAPGGYRVVVATGPALRTGQVVGGARARAMATAVANQGKVASTPVLVSGRSRSLGLALAAPGGQVIYRESALAVTQPAAPSSSAAFSEVHIVLYAGSKPDSSQVLIANTDALPLSPPVRYVPFMAGATTWLLGVAPTQPLVGALADAAPWLAAGVGLAGSLLVFLLLEVSARGRDTAMEALDSEHRFAEELQRRLLPSLPAVAGLDVSSSYVPGSDHQQVGGDWFDVFPLDGGRTALVIGDVMGHDVDAAAAMAQLRSAVRAYAAAGADPAAVVEQVGSMMDRFDIAAVVTVVYGELGPLEDGGARTFRWANAGHLPPLLRLPDGTVTELSGGASALLGAPIEDGACARPVGERLLPSGSSLLLYTDGLVEVPGGDLSGAIDRLRATVEASEGSAHDLCGDVLAAHLGAQQRDDVALLIVKVDARAPGLHADGPTTEPMATPAPGPPSA